MKKILILFLILAAAVAGAGCAKKEPPRQTAAAAKIKVIATVYPVYEFVQQVGGEKVDVSMLVPAGAEPHDWEPTAKDLIKIKDAKILFYQGAGFEHWITKVIAKEVLGNAQAVEISRGLPLIKEEDDDDSQGQHDHGHKHDSEMDPHVWLDPILAQQEIKNIAEAFASLDSANKEYYAANAERYIAELNKLHQEYEKSLANVKRRDFVTNHAAFGYLAKRYNLHQLAIMGIAPDAEPTPEKMAKTVKVIRELQLKYVFSETLLSPKLAETIARETGAKVLILHPVDQLTENELKSGQSYLTIMRSNLINLKKALTE